MGDYNDTVTEEELQSTRSLISTSMIKLENAEFIDNQARVICALQAEVRQLYAIVHPTGMKPVSRVEVIDDAGRAYINRDVDNYYIQYQDEDRTMKIFVTTTDTNANGEQTSS
jgi:hypothetical protein